MEERHVVVMRIEMESMTSQKSVVVERLGLSLMLLLSTGDKKNRRAFGGVVISSGRLSWGGDVFGHVLLQLQSLLPRERVGQTGELKDGQRSSASFYLIQVEGFLLKASLLLSLCPIQDLTEELVTQQRTDQESFRCAAAASAAGLLKQIVPIRMLPSSPFQRDLIDSTRARMFL